MNITLVRAKRAAFDPQTDEVSRGVSHGFHDIDQGGRTLIDVLSTLEPSARPAPWNAYWALCEVEAAYVGLCGFKAPPDAVGVVEIAYHTFPRCEGSGVATQMARGLVEIARVAGATAVIAHTLPEPNASGAILKRLGFRRKGIVHDPDDGAVWAWRRDLAVQYP